LKSEHHLESLVSRESSFLFNNLVLLTACFVILWGTLFPILSEYVEGNKVTVGAPFYNRVAVPIGLFLLFLDRRGPAAAVARHVVQEHQAQLCAAGDCALGHGDCLPGVGVRPWKDGALRQGNFYALVAFALAAAVLTAISRSFCAGRA
jgi:cytochrome c-type biogenesis protein CcmF